MKLAVLTSGGDSAGMNAVVRAIVKIGILRCVLKKLEIFPVLTSHNSHNLYLHRIQLPPTLVKQRLRDMDCTRGI
jgi:hypothetical protein